MERLKMERDKALFAIVVVGSFIAIMGYNFLTPLMSDELMFDASEYHSLADIFMAEYKNYMTWNGRSVVQIIMRCFSLMPKGVFNVCNSICFVILTLLMYWNIKGRKKYDYAAYALINLLVWHFGVSFDQTVLWMSGACNYLWGAVIILGFVTLYRYKAEHADNVRHGTVFAVGMFLFGVLAGWCNENTSGGGMLCVLYFMAAFYRRNKKLAPWMVSGVVGIFTGLVIMTSAPGNRLRMVWLLMAEEHSGVLAYVGRFLKINIAVETYLLPMLAIVIFILAYLLIKGRKIMDCSNAILYVAVSIATSYALVLTPQPMDRAYFGAGIFMTIACVQALWHIPRDELCLNACKYGGIVLFIIIVFFSYCKNGANLVRIMREVNEREAYILEQKAQGNMNLTVPMLRPEFKTKYSFYHYNDVDGNPEGWGCSLLREYYGLESVVGVPRSEWTEY